MLSRPPELLTFETFFVHLLAGVEKVLAERGSSLLLRIIGDHPDQEIRTYRRWWGERRVDGVIVMDERFRDPRIAPMRELNIPAVLCGGPLRNWRCRPCGPITRPTRIARWSTCTRSGTGASRTSAGQWTSCTSVPAGGEYDGRARRVA